MSGLAILLVFLHSINPHREIVSILTSGTCPTSIALLTLSVIMLMVLLVVNCKKSFLLQTLLTRPPTFSGSPLRLLPQQLAVWGRHSPRLFLLLAFVFTIPTQVVFPAESLIPGYSTSTPKNLYQESYDDYFSHTHCYVQPNCALLGESTPTFWESEYYDPPVCLLFVERNFEYKTFCFIYCRPITGEFPSYQDCIQATAYQVCDQVYNGSREIFAWLAIITSFVWSVISAYSRSVIFPVQITKLECWFVDVLRKEFPSLPLVFPYLWLFGWSFFSWCFMLTSQMLVLFFGWSLSLPAFSPFNIIFFGPLSEELLKLYFPTYGLHMMVWIEFGMRSEARMLVLCVVIMHYVAYFFTSRRSFWSGLLVHMCWNACALLGYQSFVCQITFWCVLYWLTKPTVSVLQVGNRQDLYGLRNLIWVKNLYFDEILQVPGDSGLGLSAMCKDGYRTPDFFGVNAERNLLLHIVSRYDLPFQTSEAQVLGLEGLSLGQWKDLLRVLNHIYVCMHLPRHIIVVHTMIFIEHMLETISLRQAVETGQPQTNYISVILETLKSVVEELLPGGSTPPRTPPSDEVDFDDFHRQLSEIPDEPRGSYDELQTGVVTDWMSALEKQFSGPDSAKSIQLVAVLFALSVVSSTDSRFSLSGFMAMYKGIVSNVSAGAGFATACIAMLTYLSTTGISLYAGTFNPLVLQQTNKCLRRVEQLSRLTTPLIPICPELAYISDDYPQAKLTLHMYLSHLMSEKKIGDELLIAARSQGFNPIVIDNVTATLARLAIRIKDTETCHATTSLRKCPFGVLVFGPSSVGKTTFVSQMRSFLTCRAGLPLGDQFVHYMNTTANFMDGLTSMTHTIVVDDIGALKPTNTIDVGISSVITLFNNSVWSVDKAAIEEKGKCPCLAKFGFYTANVKSMGFGSAFNLEAAALRRVPVVVTVMARRQNSKGSVEYGERDEDGFYNCWDIVLEQVRLLPAESTHIRSGVFDQKVQYVTVGEFTVTSGTGFQEFLNSLGTIYDEHEKDQDAFMTASSALKDLKLCGTHRCTFSSCRAAGRACAPSPPVAQQPEAVIVPKEQVTIKQRFLRTCAWFLKPFGSQPADTLVPKPSLPGYEQLQVGTESLFIWLSGVVGFSVLSAAICFLFFGLFRTLWEFIISLWNWCDNTIAEVKLFFGIMAVNLENISQVSTSTAGVFRMVDDCRRTAWLIFHRYRYYLYVTVITSSLLLVIQHFRATRSIFQTGQDPTPLPGRSGALSPPTSWPPPVPSFSSNSSCYQNDLVSCYQTVMKSVALVTWKCDQNEHFTHATLLGGTYQGVAMMNAHSLHKMTHVDGKLTQPITITLPSVTGSAGSWNNQGHVIIQRVLTESDIQRTCDDLIYVNLRMSTAKKRGVFGLLPVSDKLTTSPSQILVGGVYSNRDPPTSVNTIRKKDGWNCVFSNGPTLAGDCGRPLVAAYSTACCVLGLHYKLVTESNGSKIGVSIPVSQERVAREFRLAGLIKGVMPGEDEDTINENTVVEDQVFTKHNPVSEEYGTTSENVMVLNRQRMSGFRESKVERTPYSQFMENRLKGLVHTFSTWMPPQLDFRSTDGWKPANALIKNVNAISSNWDTDRLLSIQNALVEHFHGLLSNDPACCQMFPLGVNACVNGIPGVEGFEPLNKSTGWGFPRGCPKSALLLQRPDGTALLPDDLLQHHRDGILGLEEGEPQPYVFSANPKDEPIGVEKHDLRGARLIYCSNTNLTMLMRRYFLGLVRLFYRNRIQTGFCVGANVDSEEWNGMYHNFAGFSKLVLAGDFVNFDQRMPALITQTAFSVLIWLNCRLGEFGDRDRTAMFSLMRVITNPFVHLNGYLMQFFGTNPSGQALTTQMNCVVVLVYLIYVWVEVGYSIPDFFKHTRFCMYGDDHIVSVKPGFEKFNYTSVCRVLKARGIGYTTASKTEADGMTYEDLDDVPFLKRRFSPYCGIMLPVLEFKSISRGLHWWKSSVVVEYQTHILETLSARWNGVMWDRVNAPPVQAAIIEYCSEFGITMPETLFPSFEAKLKQFHASSMAWREAFGQETPGYAEFLRGHPFLLE